MHVLRGEVAAGVGQGGQGRGVGPGLGRDLDGELPRLRSPQALESSAACRPRARPRSGRPADANGRHSRRVAEARCAPPARSVGAAAGGSREARLHRDCTESTVGHGPDLCADLGGCRVRVFHRRRVQPNDRRLARRLAHAHHMVLDALEMARWSRGTQLEGLRCHSDAGSQFTSVRYGERLAEIGAVPSIGSVGDSFDNALAETVNGLYKTELIYGPARGTVEDRRRRRARDARLGALAQHRSASTATSWTCHPPSSKQRSTLPNTADPTLVGIQ